MGHRPLDCKQVDTIHLALVRTHTQTHSEITNHLPLFCLPSLPLLFLPSYTILPSFHFSFILPLLPSSHIFWEGVGRFTRLSNSSNIVPLLCGVLGVFFGFFF